MNGWKERDRSMDRDRTTNGGMETKRRAVPGRRILAACLAATLTAALAATPTVAWAASPEFAYDEETWARLKDNVLEYEEIPLLVKEYNPSYQNALETYQDDKTTDDAEQIREDMMESAADLYDQAGDLEDTIEDYGGELGPMYASLSYNASLLRANSLQLEIQADSSYTDSKMQKVQVDKTLSSLTSTVQTLMNTYFQLLENQKVLEKSYELLKASYESTERRMAAQMTTQVDVLNAKKEVQAMEGNLIQMQSSIDSTRQNLCLMTGWDYNGQPEIQEIPALDMSRIAAMNPETDKQTAVKNNYDLIYGGMAYENMVSGSSKESQARTNAEKEQSIRSSIDSLYRAVLQKQTEWESAEAAYTTAVANMSAADRKMQLGMLGNLEYLQQQSAYVQAEANVKIARLALLQAVEIYEWAVKGYIA